MPEHGPEVPPGVAGVAEWPAAEHAARLGTSPAERSARLARGHHPAAELGTQPRGVTTREIRGEHRDLERRVERPEQLECPEGAPGVGGEGDPWDNVEKIHGERACASSEPRRKVGPAGRRAKGSCDDRCRPRASPPSPECPMIHELARSWGWVALRGALAILFGVVALASPASAFAAIVLVFGAYAFVDGVFALVALFRGGAKERFWVLVLEAIVGIGIGILTFTRPAATALALALLRGDLGHPHRDLRGDRGHPAAQGDHRRVLARTRRGALRPLRQCVLFAAPGGAALALTIWIGVYAIFFGVMLLLMLAFRLRRFAGRRPPVRRPHPRRPPLASRRARGGRRGCAPARAPRWRARGSGARRRRTRARRPGR